jgi:uncharacterized membrane protein
MRWLYLTSVWLHLLAAITWIGGMFFLVLVVVPWLRSGARVDAGAFLRETGARFRTVGWSCFAILLVTGLVNLWARGVRPADLLSPAWLGSPFGRAVGLKLLVFALVLGVSGIHDFVLGPRATAAIERDPRSAEAQRVRRQASLLGRVNVLLALCLVALGVVLVRGWP